METMTGNFGPAFFAVVQIFNVRQSSLCGAIFNVGGCGHGAPNAAAFRIPPHGFGGCGGFQRSSPVGGAAYGIPLNARTSSPVPDTIPDSVLTGSAEEPG